MSVWSQAGRGWLRARLGTALLRGDKVRRNTSRPAGISLGPMTSITAFQAVPIADRRSAEAPTPATTPVDDHRLLAARASRGDVAAFEQLYRTSVSRVFALCLRMTADRERAQELSHDAFVRAWETLSTFRGESSFQSWLHRLTVNVVLQDARTTKRREARVRLADDHADDVHTHAMSEGLDPGTRLDLDQALERLAPDARRIVVLHDIEGFRHDEIATMLGVAAGTVRARLHHARKQLREWMTP